MIIVERFFLDHEYSETGKKFRRRRFKIINIVKVSGGFLILLLLFELLGILVGNLSSKPVIAGWGTMEKGFWTEALFLRDETLLLAPIDGDLALKLRDGVRIPQGEIAAAIVSKNPVDTRDQDYDLRVQLEHLNREAISLQADQRRVLLELTAKKAKLDHTPKKSIQFQQVKKDLKTIEQENASIFRNIESNRLKIESLTKRINNRQKGTALMPAERAGYLFYKYDDWEGHLSPDQFTRLTTLDFQRKYALNSPAKQVKAGMVIGKIIQPFHQVISFIIDPKQTGVPVTGTQWWLKIGKRIFECPVVNQTQLADGRMIVGLDDVSMLPEFMPQRRAKVFIVFRRISGITVPVQALYKRGQDTVVKMVKGDDYKEIKVVVRENDGVKAIIDGIKFGAMIISR
jgi:hypothetical protein